MMFAFFACVPCSRLRRGPRSLVSRWLCNRLELSALRAVVRFTPLPVVVLLPLRLAPLRLDFALVIGISFGCAATSPPPPKPHLSEQTGGAGSRSAASASEPDTLPLCLLEKSQSFLDNLIAGWRS